MRKLTGFLLDGWSNLLRVTQLSCELESRLVEVKFFLFPKVTQSMQTPSNLLGRPGACINFLCCYNFQSVLEVLGPTSFNVCSLNWTRCAQKPSQARSQLILLVDLDPLSCLEMAETHLCQIMSAKPVLPTGAD